MRSKTRRSFLIKFISEVIVRSVNKHVLITVRLVTVQVSLCLLCYVGNLNTWSK
jgi:hypothetical protein